MSATNGNGLHLDGPGGAYLRVSDDRQETERQIESIRLFEQRHGVIIPKRLWFEDRGWARDEDKQRPEFQRLLKTAVSGGVRWIVVDSLDRFGTKNAKRLFRYLDELEEAGCHLYDANDKEWTGDDDGTEITAWVGGKTSTREQKEKSKRALGGMVAAARAGEWQGGPPRLGFDVACFDRETGAEWWRVVWEGREKTDKTEVRRGKKRPVYRVLRVKVYADGRTERFDGEAVFRTSKETQAMRIVPTRDAAKLEAARSLFQRYATEAVSFYDLAMWLNRLGIRNAFGERFQSRDIEPILSDAAYLGYPTFRKHRNGRFHRYDADGGIVELEPELRGKDTASDPADIIRGTRPDGGRWYEPLVDRATWDAVARKLGGRAKAAPSPRSGGLYLSGLLTCAGCGKPMYSRKDRGEYYCSTYHQHRCEGRTADSPCLRNAVDHAELEEYVSRYLEEIGKRLEVLTQGPGTNGEHLTDHLTGQGAQAHQAFIEGIERLCGYLAQHHPDQYRAVCREYAERAAMNADLSGNGDGCNASWVGHLDEQQRTAMHCCNAKPPTPGGFVDACLAAYKANFDSEELAAEVERLEAEHTAMMRRYADLPTPRAKEKAKAELAALEECIAGLERQGQDMAGAVEQQFRQVLDLQ